MAAACLSSIDGHIADESDDALSDPVDRPSVPDPDEAEVDVGDSKVALIQTLSAMRQHIVQPAVTALATTAPVARPIDTA